jgi:hypothetical protein
MSLNELLDAGARYDAEYAGGLSNHRPMALVALARLGASDERLAAFDARYSARLQPMPPAEPWPAGDAWRGRLGEPRAWPVYRSLFAEWLAHEGSDMLPQALAGLMPGCGAAAFHGMIRTAYAVHAGHGAEIADALAYWACRWLPLDGTPPAGDHGLIFEAMQRAAAARGFATAVAEVRLDQKTPQRLAREAARLYAASGDFTVLHMLTSAHALRVLLPFVEEPMPALAAYARAFVAARRAAAVKPGRTATALPWPVLVQAALASDDEHLIKLVDSCREEEAAHGGPDWQRAASRAVRQALQART